MRIARVEVQNFRNLASCTLDLQPGLNVIVGRNNVGKSNLVDAIRHALGPAASSGDLPALDRSDFRTEKGKPLAIKVVLSFCDLSERDRTTFFEMLVPDLVDVRSSTGRLVFESRWTDTDRPRSSRSCGPDTADSGSIPSALLEALPLTFLPALRDAQAALTPGYRNRLAQLFRALASEGDKAEVLKIFKTANASLEKVKLITDTRDEVRASAARMSGTDFRSPSIRAAEPEFLRVLRSLRLSLDGEPVEDIGSTGMGYQNILYTATVLAHLKATADHDCPLLIIEEPEAHIHPQLVVMLGESLSEHEPGTGPHRRSPLHTRRRSPPTSNLGN